MRPPVTISEDDPRNGREEPRPAVRSLVHRCPWCSPPRYMHLGGAWLPTLPSGLRAEHCVFSDGICPDCHRKQMAELKGKIDGH